MLKPLSKDGWNYETAAHLLNRAGFGGPPEEINKLTDLGHEAALSSQFKPWHRKTSAWRNRRSNAPKRSKSLIFAAGG